MKSHNKILFGATAFIVLMLAVLAYQTWGR